MHADRPLSFIEAERAAGRNPFERWETIPVRFGSQVVTLAEARNLKADALARYEETLSDHAHAEMYAIYAAMNRADWECKGLTYTPPAMTKAQAARRNAAILRIQNRLRSTKVGAAA